MIPSQTLEQVFDTESTPIEDLMLLEASAGTGKTYALERIVARLIAPPPHASHSPFKIQEILVVTFTNKAAREMKERIRNLLFSRVKASTPSSLLYRQAISGFHRAPIYTIHGFCKMVLSTWPVESDSPFKQELVTDSNLERHLLRSWFSGLDNRQLNEPLTFHTIQSLGGVEKAQGFIVKQLTNSRQPGAQIQPGEPELQEFIEFLELANQPGNPLDKAFHELYGTDWSIDSLRELIRIQSGKKKQTRSLQTIKEKFASLAQTVSRLPGVPRPTDRNPPVYGHTPEEVLFPQAREPAAATFAFCQALNENGHLKELFLAGKPLAGKPLAGSTPDTAFSALPPDSETQRLAQNLARIHSLLFKHLNISAEDKINLQTWCQLAFASRAEDKLRQRIQEHKNRHGLFSYNDLIQRVSEKLSRSPSPLEQVLHRNFRAALIDEFQDTDENQWSIFSGLFGQRGRPLILIGDPKQSIYRFRGTNLQTYNKARNHIPPANRYLLNTNYRSSPPLVELTNTLFAPLFHRTGYQAVTPGKDLQRTLVWGNSPSPLTLLEASSREESPHIIGHEIRRMLDPQTGARWAETNSGHTNPVSAADIVVLCRTISGEQEILQSLKHLAIPAFTVRTKSVLEDQPLLPPLLALLAALENPEDMGLWRAVLLDEFFLLTASELVEFKGEERLKKHGHHCRHLFDRGQSTRALESMFHFATEINKTLPWPQRIFASPEGERKWTDLGQILELIQERQFADYHQRSVPAIRQWLRNPAQSVDSEDTKILSRLENDLPAVRVMTMHLAKGLEFPLVFIHAGYTQKTSRREEMHPDYRFVHDNKPVVDRLSSAKNWKHHLAEEWEEDKRLWYVALTRASHKLWIPHILTKSVNQLESLLFLSLAGLDDLQDGDSPPDVPEAEASPSLPPHEHTERKNVARFREGLYKRMEDLQNRAAEEKTAPLISIIPSAAAVGETAMEASTEPADISPKLSPLPRLQPPTPRLAPLPEHPVSERDPITSSYSSLVRAATQGIDNYGRAAAHAGYSEDADRDSPPPGEASHIAASSASSASSANSHPADSRPADSRSKAAGNPLGLFRGTLFGNMVHEILEKCPFDAARDDNPETWNRNSGENGHNIDGLFQSICGRHYPVSWYSGHHLALKNLVRTVLRGPLPGLGRLCDIPGDSRRAELEFQLVIPHEARLNAAELGEIRMFPGFLKGFIDLVIQHEGKWWIVDWKTNVLEGMEEVEGWENNGSARYEEIIKKTMDKHHYGLQYEFYLIALCRSLSRSRGRPLQWEKEMGGAMYLFVRGMNERDSRAVFMDCPESARMLYLAETLGMEGIIE